MGTITLPQCDIYKTVQRKGLRHVHVIVLDVDQDEPTSDFGKVELLSVEVAVGNRGKERVLRMVKAACHPPKTRKQPAGGEGDA